VGAGGGASDSPAEAGEGGFGSGELKALRRPVWTNTSSKLEAES
jgi:hypothetical protein